MATDLSLAKIYCNNLDEIRNRLLLVKSFGNGNKTLGNERSDYEIVAVNLRKILELIAFGSLTANKDLYAQTYAKFSEHWRIKQLFENLKKIHPDFYPKALMKPTISSGTPRNVHFEFETNGFLTAQELFELYGHCSEVIHTHNPFKGNVTINFRLSITDWTARIEKLLTFHLFRLAGLPQVWVGELSDPQNGKAHVYLASPN
ncbi:MAG: hypothetical protein E6Q51_04015 [Methylophilus methylotrophus]|uniref:Uncharacterized protein n=1 Tax=Methylophilus methylotrophus TaxID=17 RepID=A0A5C7WKC5_METME|nr:MAG: hypothetical protein E6Q51_04015 [Methylophilus methylotrophus]